MKFIGIGIGAPKTNSYSENMENRPNFRGAIPCRCRNPLEGDSIARQAFEQTAEILGIQIADSAAHSDPEAYLLLGGLSKAGNNLLILTIATMLRNLFNTYKGNVKLLLSDTRSNLAVLSPDYQ